MTSLRNHGINVSIVGHDSIVGITVRVLICALLLLRIKPDIQMVGKSTGFGLSGFLLCPSAKLDQVA